MSVIDFKPTVYLSGGLGNQLFQVASGLRLATNSLTINISQLQNAFELEDFLKFVSSKRDIQIRLDQERPNYFFTKTHNALLRRTQLNSKSAIGRVTFLITKIMTFVLFQVSHRNFYTDVDDFESFKLGNKYYAGTDIVGYFQNEGNALTIRQELLGYLNQRFEGKEWNQNGSVQTALTMHVRRGDYWSEERIGMLSVRYFKHVLSQIKKNHKIDKLNFYSNGQLSLIEFIDNSETEISLESEGLSGIELLARMRLGNIFVISNSTLSWWAAFLSEDVNKKVYAPFPWFRCLAEPVNLVPVSWNRIPAIWSERHKE